MELSGKHKLLITGGSGYIGSVLVNRAAAEDFCINVLDVSEAAPHLNAKQNVKFFKGSIADTIVATDSLRDVDSVIHLAGVSDGRAGKANPELTREVNIKALERFIKQACAAGVRRFIFASTMGVYGNKYDIPLTEDLPLAPVDPYSESKAVGEELVKNAKSTDLTVVSLRIAMVYGYSPAMRRDFIVNRLTLDALEKKQIVIMGGEQRRPQIFIEDLSEIFVKLLLIESEAINGESFNAVGVNPKLKEIAASVQQKVPFAEIQNLPARINEESFEMDGEKLRRVIGDNQRKTLDYGIEGIIEAFRDDA